MTTRTYVSCFALIAILFTTGCAMTMNYQLSTIRSSGDVASVAMIESSPTSELSATKAKVKEISLSVLAFLNTGEVKNLTDSELREELLKIVPDKYIPIVVDMLNVLSTKDVDIDKIGERNVDRLKAFCVGIISGESNYLDKYHEDIDNNS